MSNYLNYVKNNYKIILTIGIILLILPLLPTMIEMIFQVGTYVGTWIRMIGTNGMCF